MKGSRKSGVKGLLRYIRARTLLKLLGFGLAGMLSLQLGVIGTLSLTTAWRKRRQGQGSDKSARFPHIELEETTLGENALKIYSYGQDLYNDMLEAIDNARECIYLETYIWKDDKLGQEFKQRLARKAEEGVAVYVIFDSFGNLVVPREFKHFPDSIHTLEYQAMQPVRRPWQLLNWEHYALDHRKLLITDGEIGFIGGYNLGGLYATEWRDTHLRIRGPVAADLARAFVNFWNRNKPDEEISKKYPGSFDPFIHLQENDAHDLTYPIRDMYLAAINKAQHTILLTNAYFVPDHVLLRSLQAAAKRGVDVKILIPWNSNHVMVEWLTHGFLSACMEAGIHILGYKKAMLHAKTCMIDDKWVTIGTANLDRLSSLGNYEINVELYGQEIARQMRSLFECDLTNAFEVNLEDWQRRPWYAKLGEDILAPLRFIG